MTPPEHLFIGFSIGNAVYAVQHFFRGRRLSYLILLLLAGLMAVLPDFDSFSGQYTSRNIFAGHRGITHSLLFVSAVSCAITLAFVVLRRFMQGNRKDGEKACVAVFFVAALLPGLSHLLADMITPSGHWGGIPLFFPLSENGEYIRSGGWSKIGWHDYRMLFMYMGAFLVSLTAVVFFRLARRYDRGALKMSLLICMLAVNIALYAWTVGHVRSSSYVNLQQWIRVQDEYLGGLGPGIRSRTLKVQDYFLVLFHRIR